MSFCPRQASNWTPCLIACTAPERQGADSGPALRMEAKVIAYLDPPDLIPPRQAITRGTTHLLQEMAPPCGKRKGIERITRLRQAAPAETSDSGKITPAYSPVGQQHPGRNLFWEVTNPHPASAVSPARRISPGRVSHPVRVGTPGRT